jgi:DNA-binding NarL/FixJ family response regulator
MGAGLHEAHTLAEWSRHVRRTRPRDPRASELATRARAIAEPAGLVKVLARLAGDQPSASVPAGLTPRELQVLRLLVEGCSNRLVATRLSISENTAANHVRSILAKTGSENRTQAAVYATDHGLAE